MSRSYEDYEELGRYLEDVDDALGQLQGKLMYMFPLEDEERRPLPSEYEGHTLDVRFALDKLRYAIVLELDAELPGLEVPPGKPRKPPPFDREQG